MKRVERDFKGHFVCADDCHFFRTTDIGNRWRVSTIGDYRPAHRNGAQEEIGYGRTHETMVFRLGKEVCGCGCEARKVSDWCEQDTDAYNSDAEAAKGHEAMVTKWLNGRPKDTR